MNDNDLQNLQLNPQKKMSILDEIICTQSIASNNNSHLIQDNMFNSTFNIQDHSRDIDNFFQQNQKQKINQNKKQNINNDYQNQGNKNFYRDLNKTPQKALPQEFKQVKQKQLIKINNQGQLVLNQQTLDYIKSIKNKIKILSIIGPYRSGKSFLLNRFAHSQSGFQLGSTTNPCTQGIWIWDVIEDENTSILLMDTEGLFAFNRTEQIDTVLFLVTSLLSSVMIYNTFGVIDEEAIEWLSFVSWLGQYFGYLENKTFFSQEEVQKYFPELIWVLWDFSLNLENKDQEKITAKDYLEMCLQNVNEKYHNKQIDEINESYVSLKDNKSQMRSSQFLKTQQKNKIWQSIKQTFVKRNCFTLARPLDEETLLRKIDQVDYEHLNGVFKIELNKLISYVLFSIETKRVQNKMLNGEGFTEFIQQIVAGVNSERVPQIKSIFKSLSELSINNYIQKAFVKLDLINKEQNKEENREVNLNLSQLKQRYKEIKIEVFQQDFDPQEIQAILFRLKEKYNQIKALIKEQIKENQYKYLQQSLKESSLKVTQIKDQNSSVELLNIFAAFLNKNFTQQKDIRIKSSIQELFNNCVQQQDQITYQLRSQNKELQIQKQTMEVQLETKQELIQQQKNFISQTKESSQNSQLENQLTNLKLDISTLMKTQSHKNFDTNLNESFIKEISEIKQQITNCQQSQQILQTQIQKQHQDQMWTIISNLEKQQHISSSQTNQNVKDEFKLVKENENLETNNKQLQIALIKKDSEIKLLQQQLQNEEKQKKNQIQFSQLLCSISDQITYMIQKNR